MGVPSPYTSSAINTTDEETIEEFGEDIHEMQWVEVEIEGPDLMEVGPNGPTGPNGMDLTTEPSAQPVRDRRLARRLASRSARGEANLGQVRSGSG